MIHRLTHIATDAPAQATKALHSQRVVILWRKFECGRVSHALRHWLSVTSRQASRPGPSPNGGTPAAERAHHDHA